MVEPARVEATQTKGLLQLLNAVVDSMKPAKPPPAGACGKNGTKCNTEKVSDLPQNISRRPLLSSCIRNELPMPQNTQKP